MDIRAVADDERRTVKILQVIETIGSGGAETVFLELLRGLGTQGVESLAVLAGPGWVQEQVVESGIPHVVCPSSGSLDFPYLNSLRSHAVSFGADLIHGHMFGASAYAALAARGARIPMVATLHGLPDLGKPGLRRMAKALALRVGASRIVCVSDALRNVAGATLSVPPDRIITIHNGIDTDQFAPGEVRHVRKSLGVGDHDILAIAVGNFRPSKGYMILLEAIAMVRSRGVSVRFAIAGDDKNPIGDAFRVRRDVLGLDKAVTLLGFRGDIPELLRSADLYVLSSEDEGFSLTTVQAMASGLSVVATRCGGPEEIIRSSDEGLLVEPSSAAALADAIQLLAVDARRRVRMGAEARRVSVVRFAVDRMVAQYASLYRELVG